MDIKIGCDPEFFAYSTNSNSVVPACGMVPGTKEQPYLVPDGMLHVDGLALEIGIHAADTVDQFNDRIVNVSKTLSGMLPEGIAICKDGFHRFSPKSIEGLSEADLEIGCEPFFDAYVEGVNPVMSPLNQAVGGREDEHAPVLDRTVGGHIHVGWTKDKEPFEARHYSACQQLSKQLDAALGIPAVMLDQFHSSRSDYYGYPGSFRPKPYGMEYRPLSNFWTHHEETRTWVFNTVTHAFNDLVEKDIAYNTNLAMDTMRYRQKDILSNSYGVGERYYEIIRYLSRYLNWNGAELTQLSAVIGKEYNFSMYG